MVNVPVYVYFQIPTPFVSVQTPRLKLNPKAAKPCDFPAALSTASTRPSIRLEIEYRVSIMHFPLDHSRTQLSLSLVTTLTMTDGLAAKEGCPPDDPNVVRQKQLFALVPTIITMILSISTYGLRLLCRHNTAQKLWWDDYLMGIGLLISLEPSICELLCEFNQKHPLHVSRHTDEIPVVQNGLGHHICNVPADQAKRFARVSYHHFSPVPPQQHELTPCRSLSPSSAPTNRP